MNIQELDILSYLLQNKFTTQRDLAENVGYSLGVVNRSLKSLLNGEYIDKHSNPTEKALTEFEGKKVKNAVILAAGFGMRMVPINTEIPKGLLEVKGEVLIERTIRQLNSVGIKNVFVVVGFMKEKYEYLIDKFGVRLIVNPDYATKNNLYSVKCAQAHIGNSYIIPCDIYCKENPYHSYEPYSWYMVSDETSVDSTVRANRKQQLVPTQGGGNAMVGISYISNDTAKHLKQNIKLLCQNAANDGAFWESALYQNGEIITLARVVNAQNAVEINTYEQLRELDRNSNQLKNDAIKVICNALSVKPSDITDITVLKKGMTNRSFLFCTGGKKYIMRIPGEGTDMLINRREEAAVYNTLAGKNICDNIAYINPDNGYKITEFLSDARVCDPDSQDDLTKCMSRLRDFHNAALTVEHKFDIFGQIEFYESLWNGQESAYMDYKTTKANVLKLKKYIDAQPKDYVLTHIDAVPDNFMFVKTGGTEEIRLIDWEYAGMQDPHVDIAMFCVYSLYEREQIDNLIDTYFYEGCDDAVRTKIYCYIAACGLLWSNWCEYKRALGVDFGEYSLKQYRYAKDFYKIAAERLGDI
ncbi:MAG: NTP transferase domain-containing protein [Clostridia bacterium]|nr:NTP transferase domain-containing protein [Clostridia bacterium]